MPIRRLILHRVTSALQLFATLRPATHLVCVGNERDTDELAKRLKSWYVIPQLGASIRISATEALTLRDLPRRRARYLLTASAPLSIWAGLLAAVNKLRIADEIRFSSAAAIQMARLSQYDLLTPRQRREFGRLEASRLALMSRQLPRSGVAQVFGTGPSLETITQREVQPRALRIACNSAIANLAVLDLIKPHAFVFGDPAFHFGTSEYSESFRRELVQWLSRDRQRWALCPREFAILLTDLPISIQIFSARLTPFWRFRRLPQKLTDSFPRTGNILTSFLLPLAACLSGRTEVLGCDGRSRDDKGFWKLANSRLTDTYTTVSSTHPGYFSRVDYDDYYDLHCKRVELIIRRLEAAGHPVCNVTSSNIPALAARQCPAAG